MKHTYFSLTLALLTSAVAISAMDIKNQEKEPLLKNPSIQNTVINLDKIADLEQGNSQVTLDHLKTAAIHNNADNIIALLDKAQSQSNASDLTRNFEQWFNGHVNIYEFKKFRACSTKLFPFFLAAIAQIALTSVIGIASGPTNWPVLATETVAVLGAFTIGGAIINTYICCKSYKQIKKYTPHKTTIDAIIATLKKIDLINQEKQLKKEQEENKKELAKLTNEAK